MKKRQTMIKLRRLSEEIDLNTSFMEEKESLDREMSNKMGLELSDFLSRYDFETVEMNDSVEFMNNDDIFLQVVCEHPKIDGRLSFSLSKGNFWMNVIHIPSEGYSPTLVCFSCPNMARVMDYIKKHFNNIKF